MVIRRGLRGGVDGMTTRPSANGLVSALLGSASVVAILLVAPIAARGDDQLVPCCDTSTCQLVLEQNCKHPESGTTCDGVACSGCCQGLAGNPNLCSDNFGKVACVQGAGNFLAHAHCSA